MKLKSLSIKTSSVIATLIAIFAVSFAGVVSAEIPPAYKPFIIEPPFSFGERVIDIAPALAKAKADKKPLLLYIGAPDCPPCKVYGQFLAEHQQELLPSFSKFTVVDIRTWLSGTKNVFLVNGQKYSFSSKPNNSLKGFNELVGDANSPSFPSLWILDENVKQMKQLPRGASEFMDVGKHKALLSLSK